MLGAGLIFASYSDFSVPKEQAWVWKVGDSELYIDTNEKIRFRVEQEYFTQQIPKRPGENDEETVSRVAPYSIVGSCQVDGMGLISWWDE
jgi:DNA-directed RNA polymerase III subunit RPC8